MTKILLAEQGNKTQWQLMADFLDRGFDLVVSEDGLDAVAIAQVEAPDVIVMSMDLPQLDGWQVTEQLKSSFYTQNIPIIAMTNENKIEDMRRCVLVGCDVHMVKPVQVDQLAKEIEALLSVNVSS